MNYSSFPHDINIEISFWLSHPFLKCNLDMGFVHLSELSVTSSTIILHESFLLGVMLFLSFSANDHINALLRFPAYDKPITWYSWLKKKESTVLNFIKHCSGHRGNSVVQVTLENPLHLFFFNAYILSSFIPSNHNRVYNNTRKWGWVRYLK